MSSIHFSATPLGADRIDDVNGIIRGVSVISSGLIARGHDLAVDQTTLDQMQMCAEAKGKIPVKIDHKSGAENVVGYLTNFRQEENKLKADWYLLESHPQRNQILETVRRMPRGVGLSAAFVSPDKPEHTKSGKKAARCEELISVDYVTLPAANPDGMFAARRETQQPISGLEKVRRAIGAAGRGAEVGAVSGLAARALLRRRVSSDGSAMTGAAIGAITAGALQWRRDKRDLAARVSTILFDNRQALRRLTDATANNLPAVPGADGVGAVVRVAKKPLVRRIAGRLVKIGAGAGLGYYAGRRIGAKAGAVGGAVAGLLFSNADVRSRVRLSTHHANRVSHS